MAKMKMPTPDELTGMLKASGLKEKLIFTFIMIAVFRFGTHVPIFGIDSRIFSADNNVAANIIGLIDMFTGGGLKQVSIFALGIGPYITSSIIMQLLAVVIPQLEVLQKEEGEAGRRKLSQYTRIATVGLALFQSFILMTYLNNAHAFISTVPTMFVFVGSMITLTAGSIFIMWIAELLTERGIGNGASLLIFIGILSRIPFYYGKTAELVSGNPDLQLPLVILLLVFVAVILFIIVMQEAVRKVVIVNAKRQVGNKVYGGVNTHIPFKLNPGGVMPIVFAIAIMLFPSTMIQALLQKMSTSNHLYGVLININKYLFDTSSPTHYVFYFLLIVALTFFYASIMPNMQPREIADNLKKYGSSVPGVKPGKPTSDLLDKILGRTTFIGAVGLGIIALIPNLASTLTGISSLSGLGATGLIIMVGVALDFINQIKTHLLVRQYEGFLKQ